MWFNPKTNGQLSGRGQHAGCPWPACLVLSLTLIACVQPTTHDHIALEGKPESLEQTAPTWVGDFALSVTRDTAIDGLVDGPQPIRRPHVILISLDTLRADHLGAWGYNRQTSPFLDALAQNGIRFQRVYSQSPKTAPSHMSLFTGTYPSAHGTHFAYKTSPPMVYPAARDLELLPEIMRRAGYRTAAWTGGGQVSSTAGFDRGFDEYSEDLGDIDSWKMNEVRAWFRRNSDEPCFLFIHTYQIHDPYLPPSPYNVIFASDYEGWVIGDKNLLQTPAGGTGSEDLYHAFWRTPELNPDPASVGPADLQQLVALYDGGIRYTDDVLHGFFEDLRQDGLLDNTLVVVFSDHGEEFLEHNGLLHEKLYRETLHVPLMLFWPERLPGDIVIESQVPLIDLGPTLLDLAAVETPPHMEGRSLLPLLQDPGRVNHRFVFSEEPWVHDGHHRSIRDGSHTLYDHGAGEIELFSVVEDPFEHENLFPTQPELGGEMHHKLLEFIAAHGLLQRDPHEEARNLSPDEIEALRALGYIE